MTKRTVNTITVLRRTPSKYVAVDIPPTVKCTVHFVLKKTAHHDHEQPFAQDPLWTQDGQKRKDHCVSLYLPVRVPVPGRARDLLDYREGADGTWTLAPFARATTDDRGARP